MDRMWKPLLDGQSSWIVARDVDLRKETRIVAIGGDGLALRFWSYESAQLKADALNKKDRP